jgi:hypothetical protein
VYKYVKVHTRPRPSVVETEIAYFKGHWYDTIALVITKVVAGGGLRAVLTPTLQFSVSFFRLLLFSSQGSLSACSLESPLREDKNAVLSTFGGSMQEAGWEQALAIRSLVILNEDD